MTSSFDLQESVRSTGIVDCEQRVRRESCNSHCQFDVYCRVNRHRLGYKSWLGVWLISCSAALAAETNRLSPDQIAKYVSRKMILSDSLAEDNSGERLISYLRAQIPRMIERHFPANFEAKSLDLRNLIPKIRIRRWDLKYNELVLEKHILKILFKIRFRKLVRPLTENQRKVLAQNADAFVRALIVGMKNHLLEAVPQQVVEECLQEVEDTRGFLHSPLSHLDTPYMKEPLGKDKMSRFLEDLDSRLRELPKRIANGIAEVEAERLTETQQPRGPEQENPERTENGIQETPIVMDILNDAIDYEVDMFLDATADPKLTTIRAKQLAPGYDEVMERLNASQAQFNLRIIETGGGIIAEERERKEALSAINDWEERRTRPQPKGIAEEDEMQQAKSLSSEPAGVGEGTNKLPISEDKTFGGGSPAPPTPGPFPALEVASKRQQQTTEVRRRGRGSVTGPWSTMDAKTTEDGLLYWHPGKIILVVIINLVISLAVTYIIFRKRRAVYP